MHPPAVVAAALCFLGHDRLRTQRDASNTTPFRTCVSLHANKKSEGAQDDKLFVPWSDSSSSESDSSAVSDAEVLLACRAYLVRHKRVPWSNSDKRKRWRERSLAITEGESGGVGYFWENPEELVYMKGSGGKSSKSPGDPLAVAAAEPKGYRGKRSETSGSNSEESGYLAMTFDDHWADGVVEEDYDEEDEDGDGRSEHIGHTEISSSSAFGPYFGDSFLNVPSEEHTRRSKAEREKWTDPKWKDKWYQRRWGERERVSEKEKKQNKLEKMLDKIPADILGSPELQAMSAEEVSTAVQTYLQAREKRSESATAYVINDSEATEGSSLRVDNMAIAPQLSEEDRLRAKQKERSERAKRAYATRRANEKKNRHSSADSVSGPTKPVIPSALPHVFVAQQAMERIEWALYSNQAIDVNDIDILLVPGKMSGRKDLLLRILSERFDLRGKCVPADINAEVGSGKLLFATTAPLAKLADLVKRKLND